MVPGVHYIPGVWAPVPKHVHCVVIVLSLCNSNPTLALIQAGIWGYLSRGSVLPAGLSVCVWEECAVCSHKLYYLLLLLRFCTQGNLRAREPKWHLSTREGGGWRGLREVLIKHSLQLRQGEPTGGYNELQTEGLPDEDLENMTESDLLIVRKLSNFNKCLLQCNSFIAHANRFNSVWC